MVVEHGVQKEKRYIVYAQFLGEDGSMGYAKMQCYHLLIVERAGEYPIVIFLLNCGVMGHSYYASEKAFQKNWSVQNIYDEVKDPLHEV